MQRNKKSLVAAFCFITLCFIALGAAPAYAGGGGGHSSIVDLLWYFVNFFVFFGFLFLITRKKFVAFWIKRSDDIEAAVTKGERELAKAKEELQAVELKLQGLAKEIETIRTDASNGLDAELSELKQNAETDRERLQEQTQSLLEAEKRNMEKDLRAQLADYVISEAEKRISEKLNADTDKDRRAYSAKVYGSALN